MQRNVFSQKFFSLPDLLILLFLATCTYAMIAIGNEFRADFHPVTEIDLSLRALPYYTLLSASRGIVAYLLSLVVTLILGFAAAKSRAAERIIIPMIDILQSLPVLTFLPGLVLGLTALFPHRNLGLELAAILLIFTGQVWNMIFSLYSSLKSVPTDFKEASSVIGLSWFQKLVRVELPFSAVGLAWNSVLSMAGGWFFLASCEAYSMGEHSFQLPGLGSYMQVAVDQGNKRAMALGVLAMVGIIVVLDFFIWRPILSWVQRFRLEDVPGVAPSEPLMQSAIRESKIVRWFKLIYRQRQFEKRVSRNKEGSTWMRVALPVLPQLPKLTETWGKKISKKVSNAFLTKVVEFLVIGGIFAALGFGSFKFFALLSRVTWPTWVVLLRGTMWTTVRVFSCLVISTIWAVPVGIWLGTQQKRVRIAQPIIQILASFPAPMLYPIVLPILFWMGIPFAVGCGFLMLLGVQWYVLFNVLAGAMRIPQELGYALDMMNTSRFQRWRTLYLPSVFPALVTGWITAAGGAWNASIVSEIFQFNHQKLVTSGIGALIGLATEKEDFAQLAAGISIMIVIVIVLNRGFWSKLYHLAQNRFRLDL